ncbi:hypothetical protein CRG98_029191, partial [Punica granatum]
MGNRRNEMGASNTNCSFIFFLFHIQQPVSHTKSPVILSQPLAPSKMYGFISNHFLGRIQPHFPLLSSHCPFYFYYSSSLPPHTALKSEVGTVGEGNGNALPHPITRIIRCPE